MSSIVFSFSFSQALALSMLLSMLVRVLVAIENPTTPRIMIAQPKIFSSEVLGEMSPNPTVVTVVMV